MHEADSHEHNSFLTLTYDDEHLEQRSLNKRDWQLFAKKLRHHGAFRFYMVGEYTDDWRPHYHACLFGQDFTTDRRYWCQSRGKFPLYRSELLESVWDKGFSYIGELTTQSARYCSGYILKKITGQKAEQHYQWVDTQTGTIEDLAPEFALMSRRPGIGKGWFERYADETYRDDYIVLDGKKFLPPKYYDRLLATGDPTRAEAIATARVGRLASSLQDNTRARLLDRERVAQDKEKLKVRGFERTCP